MDTQILQRSFTQVSGKPVVACVETGGTFASVPTSGGKTPRLSIEGIVRRYVKQAQDLVSLVFPEIGSPLHFGSLIDSSNAQPEDWVRLAAVIARHMASAVDGVIVTSGTDTMAFLSSALSLFLINPPKPIIITGSQRTLDEQESDAPRNFLDSAFLINKLNPAIYIVFNGKVFPGRSVTKMSSIDLDAYATVNTELSGTLTESGFQNLILPKMPHDCPGVFRLDSRFDNRVRLESLIPGYEPKWLKSTLEDESIRGVIIQGYGRGGVPCSGERELISIIDKFASVKPIVVASHCKFGGVDLNEYEVGKRALAAGALSAKNYSLEYSSFKLKVLLGRCKNIDDLREQWNFESQIIH